MTLTQKLVLYALAVALLPLAATGFTLIHLSEEALRERIMAHQRTTAAAVASSLRQSLDDLGERLTTALELVDPLTLAPPEREGLLRLLARQSPAIRLALLLDDEGAELAPPVVLTAGGAPDPGAATNASAAAAGDSARLRGFLPHADVFKAGGGDSGGSSERALASQVYFAASGPARIAMGVGCCGGTGGLPKVIAGVEVALENNVLAAAAVDTGTGSRVFVVDAHGRVIAHSSAAVGTEMRAHPAVAPFLMSRAATSTRYEDEGGVWVAASVPVPDLGWAVVVEQPEQLAFAQAAALRQRVLTWILVTTGVVLLSGLLFANRLRRRLARLVSGARAFGAGKLKERVPERPRDEIGELGGTMNGMAEDLSRTLAELAEWSRTLESRVEERTRELKEAQAQLVMQSKLAAVGQLGAGVAHEVNNPLASILGYAQLLLRKHGDGDADNGALRKIEEAAQRCKGITTNLLRFSQRGVIGRAPLDINKLVDEVLGLMQGSIDEAAIKVERELAVGLPEILADGGQISIALINIVTNARDAMRSSGGVLQVRTEATADGVAVSIRDTGHGIEAEHLPRIFEPFFTTKKVWTGVGLGLSVAYRVVADHGGRIEVESTVGVGSCFRVVLVKEPPAVEAALPAGRPVLLA